MVVSSNFKIILIFIITMMILDSDTREPSLKDILTDPRDRTASKRVANGAMEVMFGNRSMIDVLSKEVSGIVNRYTSRMRPVRSPLGLPLRLYQQTPKPAQKEPRKISRVEINFINRDNQTVHTIVLQPSHGKKPLHLPDYSKTLLHI